MAVGGGGRGLYVCINVSQIFNSEYSKYMRKMWINGGQRVLVGNERNVMKWAQISKCLNIGRSFEISPTFTAFTAHKQLGYSAMQLF